MSDKRYALLIYVVLILSTLIAYEPLRHNDFISYDDYTYVTKNPNVTGGITRKSVLWAFTGHHFYMWHPLTSLSHLLDCQLFGLDPRWHHLTSLLLHIASTVLLFMIFKKTTGMVWPSAFVAAAFALHPLNVESVAWAAERKTVVSGLFWMLTLATYIRYAERPSIASYMLVIFVYGLTIMTKPVVVPLPFVLLLLDYWPLGRFRWSYTSKDSSLPKSAEIRFQASPLSRVLTEKIPFFILAAILSITTFLVQKGGGAVLQAERLALSYRIGNALVSYVRYIGKMIYPSRLAILYPHPANRLPLWLPIVCFIILAIVSAGIIYTFRRQRYLVVGWLWYLGILVPVIGLVQVGSQAMADRYTYLPAIGIFIMVAWGAVELLSRWRYRRICLGISAGCLFVALLICTRTQVKYWRNNLTLYEHVLSVTENNAIIHNSYGCALFEDNRLDESVNHFKKALAISPKFSVARINLGKVFVKQKKFNEAITCFNEVLRTRKDWIEAYYHLGQSYAELGKSDLAISNYYEALKLKPDYRQAHYSLALAMTKEGKYDAAINHFDKALQLKPDWFEAHNRLALIYLVLGRYDKVVAHWRQMVKLKPDDAEVHNNLAWVLATNEDANIRNPSLAIEFSQRACELTQYKHPNTLDTLAVTYAAAGRFTQAIETAEKAIKLAEAQGNKDMAEKIKKRLQLFHAGQPYREK